MRDNLVSQEIYPSADIDLSEAERCIKQTAARFLKGKARGDHLPPHIALKAPAGTGKSHIMQELIPSTMPGGIDYFVPTTKKAVEIVQKNPHFMFEAPRNSGDPDYRIPDSLLTEEEMDDWDDDDKRRTGCDGPMCAKYKRADEVAKAGLSVIATMCQHCPLKELCGYFRQVEPLEAHQRGGGTIVRTHARLTCAPVVPLAPMKIIDESLLPTALGTFSFTRDDVSHEKLSRYLPTLEADYIADILSCTLSKTPIRHPVLVNRALKTLDKQIDKIEQRDIQALRGSKWQFDARLENSGAEFLTGLRAVLKQIRDALSVQEQLSTFREVDGVFTFHLINALALKPTDSIMLLDATYRQEIMEMVLPDIDFEIVEAPVAMNIEVTHLVRNCSSQHLKSEQNGERRRKRIIDEAQKVVGDKALLVAKRAFSEGDEAFDVPAGWQVAGFGGLRGSNDYQGFDNVVVVGAAVPPADIFECQAAALFLHAGVSGGIQTVERDHNSTYLPVDDDGLYFHPDDLAAALIDAQACDDITQAIGRARSVRKDRPCKAVVVGQFAPADLEPYVVARHNQLGETAADVYVDEVLQKHGCVSLAPSRAVALRPDLFGSESTASRQISNLALSKKKDSSLGRCKIGQRELVIWQIYLGESRRHSVVLADPGLDQAAIQAVIGEFRLNQPLPEDVHIPEGADVVPEQSMTFLTHSEAPASKTFRQTEGGELMPVSSYGSGKNFVVETTTLAGPDDMHDQLVKKSGDPKAFAIRGFPKAYAPVSWNTRRTLDVFSDVAKHWVMIDIDGFHLPMGMSVVEDPEYAIMTVLRQMGAPFDGAGCTAQLSASCGVRDTGKLKVHLWFWMSIPLTGKQVKAALAGIGQDLGKNKFSVGDAVVIDGAPFNAVQPHYIANPVILPYRDRPATDIFEQRLFKIEGGHLALPLPMVVVDQPLKPIEITESMVLNAPARLREKLMDIGGDGFQQPILMACRPAAIGIMGGMDVETPIALIQQAVLAADPGGRDRGTIERYASREFIGDKIKWWTDHLS